MQTIGNRSFYTTYEEMFDKKHTALLVIDMQNDYTHPDGYYGRRGIDLSMIRETIKPIRKLLDCARRNNVLVIYSQHTILPGFASDSPLWLQIHANAGLTSLDQTDFFTLDGSWGQQIIDELKPEPGDIVLKKMRANFFVGTSLDTILRSHGIESVAVTGQVTQGCVENTVRMARDLDYYTAMVIDCVASTKKQFHDNTVANLGARMPMPTSDELCAIWEG